MTTTTTAKFAEEVNRRLIDSFELMNLLGLRSRQGVWDRVKKGDLPQPIFTRSNAIALWDREALPDSKEGK